MRSIVCSTLYRESLEGGVPRNFEGVVALCKSVAEVEKKCDAAFGLGGVYGFTSKPLYRVDETSNISRLFRIWAVFCLLSWEKTRSRYNFKPIEKIFHLRS